MSHIEPASDQCGAQLDARIAALEDENRELRNLLNNGYLLVTDPANAFLAAKPWRREVWDRLGGVRGCMVAAYPPPPAASDEERADG